MSWQIRITKNVEKHKHPFLLKGNWQEQKRMNKQEKNLWVITDFFFKLNYRNWQYKKL